MAVQKIGLESIFETKQFQKGLQIYLDGLKRSETATSKVAQSSTAAGQGLTGGLVPGMASVSTSATLMAGAIAGAAAAIGIKLLNAISDAVTGLISFQKESVLTAARVNELTIVAQLLGQRAGFTADEVERETQKIRDFGIRTDVALSLVAQFSRRQLDMADASKIARIAQDAAVLSMQDSSDALDKIMLGILTYNKRILRTSGLMVDIRGEFALMAESLDITTEELTEQQKIQAAMNGVMKEGAAIAGVYAAAMETPGKQLRSLKRDVFDLSNALGQPFQQAFAIVIKATREMTKALTAALNPPKELSKALGEVEQEGGQLHKLMVNLGAAASIMADGFRFASEILVNWLVGGMEQANNVMETTAKNAFEWGINIAVELADGLITGAVSALTWAMNQITALFSFWLSGASPPRAIPDLPEWGANAMTEFLKGFTNADFSALKAIQGPLQKALQILMQTGKIGKEAGGALLADISTQLAKILSGGKLDPSFFKKITKAVGPFGVEIADLTKKVLALAEAEERIERARKNEAVATKKVRDGIEKYNRLLRAGATEDALDQRLELINASEAEAQAARDQRSEAEQNLDTLKEAVKLQSQLVEQLLMLTQAQILMPDLSAVGAEAGKGLAGGIAGALSNIDMSGFQAKIASAIEEAKARLLGLFEPLTTKWAEEWAPLFAELGRQWDLFEIKFLTVWFRLFGPERGIVTTTLKELDFTSLTTAFGELGISFGTLLDAVASLAGIDTSGTSNFFEKLELFMESKAVVILQEQIELLAKDVQSLADALDAVAKFLPGLKEDLTPGLSVLGRGTELTEQMGSTETASNFERFLLFMGKVDGSHDDVQTGVEGLERVQRGWMIFLGMSLTESIATFIAGAMTNLSTSFGAEGSLYQNVITMKDVLFPDLILGIDAVTLSLDRLIVKLGELVTAMSKVDWSNLDEVTEHSPPPLAAGLKTVRQQLTEFIKLLPQIETNITMPDIMGTQSPINIMPSPAMATVPVVAGAQTQSISLTFETIINSDVDLAKFEDRVSRIVIKLLT